MLRRYTINSKRLSCGKLVDQYSLLTKKAAFAAFFVIGILLPILLQVRCNLFGKNSLINDRAAMTNDNAC